MPDQVDVRYQQLACYQLMSEEDRKKFDILANYYGKMLNDGPVRTNIIYTLHDFDHHCYDIYYNISIFILGKEGLEQLNPEERYILNLSVLFHDISMCKGGYDDTVTPFDRDIHSLQSAQWIKHEYNSKKSILFTNANLTPGQVKMISNICQAHSDLKKTGVDMGQNGIFNKELLYTDNGSINEIRVKTLAGILRLADEMDVSSMRLGNTDRELMLLSENASFDNEAEKQLQENDAFSRKHWDRLHLILKMRKSGSSKLILVLDDDEVNQRISSGDTLNVREDLQNIQKKIQNELDSLWMHILDVPNAKSDRLVTLRSIEWDPKQQELLDQLPLINDTRLNPQQLESIKNAKPDTHKESTASGITLLNLDLAQRITKEVNEKKLLSIGHFQLNSKYCTRDWIDTSIFLKQSPLTTEIVQTISNDIFTRFCNGKYIIVGLDVAGSDLTSKIAFSLKCPFTYVIPAHQCADAHEINIPNIPADYKVILVTDSITTGITISQIVQNNNWERRILSIYSIFYRKAKAYKDDISRTLQYQDKTYTLNQSFPVEISLVENCPFGNDTDSCHAINKKT